MKTTQCTQKIRELWDKGYASGSIAIIIGAREREVQRYLREHGLRRSPSEAREIRKKNGIPFYIRNGLDESDDIAPIKKRSPQMSIYDSVITDKPMTKEQIERICE